jgi:hypothetical protein
MEQKAAGPFGKLELLDGRNPLSNRVWEGITEALGRMKEAEIPALQLFIRQV